MVAMGLLWNCYGIAMGLLWVAMGCYVVAGSGLGPRLVVCSILLTCLKVYLEKPGDEASCLF